MIVERDDRGHHLVSSRWLILFFEAIQKQPGTIIHNLFSSESSQHRLEFSQQCVAIELNH